MRILYLFLIPFLFLSCDKHELGPDDINDPQLFVKFNIGQEKYEYYAGLEPHIGQSDLLLDQDLRAYEFSVCHYLVDTQKYFIVNFINHTKPFGNLATDVLETFSVDSYDFAYSTPPVSNPYQLKTATLSWFDNDIRYTSFFYEQNDAFIITGVESHIDELGQGYILVDASFECVLKNPQTTDTVYLQNGETRFIVELQ